MAYQDDSRKNNKINLVDAENGTELCTADTSGDVCSVAWSPNQTKLTWCSESLDGFGYDLYAASLHHGKMEKKWHVYTPQSLANLSWDPKGAYISSDINSTFCVFNATNGSIVWEDAYSWERNQKFRWTSSGNIIYQREPKASDGPISLLVSRSINTGDENWVLSRAGNITAHAVSPAEDVVAYSEESSMNIHFVNAQTSKPIASVPACYDATDLVWSPKGRKLAVLRSKHGGVCILQSP